MEVTALCFRLLMLSIIQLGTQVQKSDAVFLRITPNRLQHFQHDSVSFDCVGFNTSIKLRGIRNTEEFTPACDNKRTPTRSFCTLGRAYTGESGEYWCETDGERSNSVNITVTAGSVILESPVLPVIEGNDVTLRCRHKTNSTNLQADFYKDGVFMKRPPAAETTINNVSKCDEGFYRCNISGVGISPESWLAVRANSVSVTSQTPHEENHVLNRSSISLLLWIAVIILMVFLVLLVVGFICVGIHRGTVLDTAGAADNSSLNTNHRRKPQKDEGESSLQSVYYTLTLDDTPQALQPEAEEQTSEVVLY